MKIVGYGVCGPKEKYLENTLKEFKRLCDEVIIVGNNIDKPSADLIKSYRFKLIKDNREWGLNQHRIKEDLVKKVEKLNPDWCVCLDMDEVFDERVTRESIEEFASKSRAYYVYVLNLVDEGWSKKWSFWNVRLWRWDKEVKEHFGDDFYRFENRPLHCGLAPKWAYLHASYAPFVLVHSGLKDKDDREKKAKRYELYDPEAKYQDQSYYKFLTTATGEPLDIQSVRDGVKAEIDGVSYKDRPIQASPTVGKKAFCFFRRKRDGAVLDIPESHYPDMKKNKDFEELYWVGK